MHQNTFVLYAISLCHVRKTSSNDVKIHKVDSVWQSHANRLLIKISCASQWVESLKQCEIRFLQNNAIIISVLQDYSQALDHSQEGTTDALMTDSLKHCLLVTRQYFVFLSDSRAAAENSTVTFQKLVFMFICVILLHQECQKEIVDSLMCNTFDYTSDKNLKRLRLKALWANKLINSLSKQDWDERASDLFFLC